MYPYEQHERGSARFETTEKKKCSEGSSLFFSNFLERTSEQEKHCFGSAISVFAAGKKKTVKAAIGVLGADMKFAIH